MKYMSATYKIRGGTQAQVQKIVREFVSKVGKNEPGTLAYEVFVQKDGVTFLHVMTFANAAAEKVHVSSDYVKKFVGELYPLCISVPDFYELKLVSAKSTKGK